MLYFTAFITGILGSFHCLGMCGPLALLAPQGQNTKQFVVGRLAYHSARIGIYATMGLLLGFLGQGLQLAGIQQYISVSMGILLLVIAISKITGSGKRANNKWFSKYKNTITQQFSKFISKPGIAAQASVGALNGLLPCGLVYIALAGAVTSINATQGALYMGLFGIGTLPMLLSVSFASRWATQSIRSNINRAMPYFVTVVAVLFIVRGLNLGIPYLSPQINQQNQIECCEKP